MRTGKFLNNEFAQYIVDAVESDGTLYRQMYRPITINLAKKKANGTYEREKAIKGVMYLAVEGIRKFKKHYEAYNEKPYGAVSAATKHAIAVELLSGMLDDINEVAREIKAKRKK